MAKKRSYMNSADIIVSVKRRCLVPLNQSTFTEEDLLAFADEEMSIGLVPSVISAHEDYLMYTEVVPMNVDQTRYPIPYRSIGNRLREISFEDQSGNVFEMTRIGVGEIPFYNLSSAGSRAYAFYVENNEIVLTPQNAGPFTDAKLRMTYYMRPSTLVMPEEVATISSIDRNTGIIQLNNLPTDFVVTELLDLIKVQSPNKILNFDVTPLAINSTSKTITLNVDDIPDSLAAGDQIALAEESCIPQVPSDLHVVLAHRVAARVLEALGDTEGLQNANVKLAEMEKKTQSIIDNRVEDAPLKCSNRHSIIRSGLNSRTRFRR